MIVLSSNEQLMAALAATTRRIIAIDGYTLAGKSTLGAEANQVLGRRWLDLDAFLHPEAQGSFVDHVDYSALADAIEGSDAVVVTGICMRAVLERLGSPRAVHIYVKRMHHGFWTDKQDATLDQADVDALVPPSALRLELRRYHAEHRPHERADYVLERSVLTDGD